MDKLTMEKVNTFLRDRLPPLMKYMYLVHIILCSCNLLCETPLTKITSLCVLGCAAMILLERAVHFKRYTHNYLYWMYFAFLASYVVSSVHTMKYGIVSNAKITIWMTIWFAILYMFDRNADRENVNREFRICLWIVISMCTVMNIINTGMLLSGFNAFRQLPSGSQLLIGVASWGRLFGIFVDPNYATVFSIAAFLGAIYLLIEKPSGYKPLLLKISMFFQFVYMTFSVSRTGMVVISAALFLFLMLVGLIQKKNMVRQFCVSLLIIASLIALESVSIKGYNAVSKYLHVSDEAAMIGREDEISGDISNRRFDLWENGVQLFQTSPVVGISYGNYLSYARDVKPDSYMLTNDYKVFDAFHNFMVDLLVSQGVIGFALFALIMVLSLIHIGAKAAEIPEGDQLKCAFLFSLCCALVSSGFFLSHILYVNNMTSVVFWIFWGYLIYFVSAKKQQTGSADLQ